jgi:hypothetical protein
MKLELELIQVEFEKLPNSTCIFCWKRSTIGAERNDVCDTCLPRYMSAEKRYLDELKAVESNHQKHSIELGIEQD